MRRRVNLGASVTGVLWIEALAGSSGVILIAVRLVIIGRPKLNRKRRNIKEQSWPSEEMKKRYQEDVTYTGFRCATGCEER